MGQGGEGFSRQSHPLTASKSPPRDLTFPAPAHPVHECWPSDQSRLAAQQLVLFGVQLLLTPKTFAASSNAQRVREQDSRPLRLRARWAAGELGLTKRHILVPATNKGKHESGITATEVRETITQLVFDILGPYFRCDRGVRGWPLCGRAWRVPGGMVITDRPLLVPRRSKIPSS